MIFRILHLLMWQMFESCDLCFLMRCMIVFGSFYCPFQKYGCFAWVSLSHIYSWSQHSRLLLLKEWKCSLPGRWIIFTHLLSSGNHLTFTVFFFGMCVFFFFSSAYFGQSSWCLWSWICQLSILKQKRLVTGSMASNGVEPFQEPTNYLCDYSSLTMVKCYCCCAALFNALWNKI